MALETGNYIGDLVVANPTPGDPKSQGDDHIRLIKSVLRACFPGFAGAIIVGGADTGTADAYVVNTVTPLLGYSANTMFLFRPSATNATATPTLNVSGLGALPIKAVDGADLFAGDIPAGRYISVVYNGTVFQLLGVTKRYVDNLAFAAVLPNQANNAGRVLTTDGATASWQLPTAVLNRSARTASAQLVAADRGTLIDITAGTFTQTFAAAATLGAGWWCYVRNGGTGQITIPASDGRTNWIMYPGEMRLFQCDGAAFNSAVMHAYRFVDSTGGAGGNYIKPPGYNYHRVRGQGGGQGGGAGGGGASAQGVAGSNGGPGASGGASGASGIPAETIIADAVVPNSVPYAVGSGGNGGAAGTGGAGRASGVAGFGSGTDGGNGVAGTPTTFGTVGTMCYLSAPGGAATANAGRAGGPGNSPGPAVPAAGATALSATTAGAVVLLYPSTVGGGSTAGANPATVAGGTGGTGGTSSASPATVTTVAGGTGGAAAATVGMAGNNGASVTTQAGIGCGGAGGGGGGGSAAPTGSNAATGKGGDGGAGGKAGDGQIEVAGVI